MMFQWPTGTVVAEGHSIAPTARDLLAKPAVPGWVYRLLGSHGWKQQAKKYGMEKNLKRRPYAVSKSRARSAVVVAVC
jgi:hypothetical protein